MSLALISGQGAAYALDACSEDAPAQAPRAKLQLAVGFDAQRAWISAQYRQLGIRKQTSREPRQTAIELRHAADTVTVTIGSGGTLVSRGSDTVLVDSPDALAAAYDLLSGSPAVFAARATLSEFENESELQAPEMSLLSALAFVASLVGDTNAPQRLSDRFVAKYRGVVRPVRWTSCWQEYTTESTSAWNDLQACMEEADQDSSFFRAAYRRLACNTTWALRADAAWFEFLGCIQPLKTVK